MIIVKLIGGLGNQLFQYAAARRLSLVHRTNLKLDIIHFDHYKLHAYALKHFSIQETFASPEEIAELKGTMKKDLGKAIFGMSQRLKPYYRRSIFSEPHLRPFDPNILKTPKDVYLDGYWQSEKYFAPIQDVIRRELIVKYGLDPKSLDIAEKIAKTESVSVHVRRADYVSNSEHSRVHGTCSLEYYNRCVSLMGEKLTDPYFFVFSDDPRWIKENLRFGYPTTFVTHNDASRNYEDLRLMSLCKHGIIANSSFSWWGAWLNTNTNKIVLAPSRWFNQFTADTRDLLPDSWIKVC
jgi:hypothetical protein